MAGRSSKIIRYRRPFQFNIGIFIFIIFFLYLFFTVTGYMGRNKVNFYEVSEGDMVKNTEHTGLALRDEAVQYSAGSGYVNFFSTPGKRVAVGASVYSLDETGGLTRYLEENSLSQMSISDENLRTIRRELAQFSSDFSETSFRTVYNVKAYMDSAMIEYAGSSSFENLDALLAGSGISYSRISSPYSGILSLDIDGYEALTPEAVKESNFDRSRLRSSRIKSGQLVEKDTPVFKIIRSETWDIVFPLTEEERTEYAGRTVLPITFTDRDISCSPAYVQFAGTDGNYYGRLTLSKYVVDFCSDRFVSFEINTASKGGLKIPRSAVVSKTFLTIPYEYLAHGGDDIQDGFLKEIYTDAGTSVQFTPVTIYYSDGANYYIDMAYGSPIQPGDYIVKPETNERLRLTGTASLQGVYNINKGYAVFKQIDVIDSNDEYYIVSKNQKYGLAVYDHILFDPEGINEGDFIYR